MLTSDAPHKSWEKNTHLVSSWEKERERKRKSSLPSISLELFKHFLEIYTPSFITGRYQKGHGGEVFFFWRGGNILKTLYISEMLSSHAKSIARSEITIFAAAPNWNEQLCLERLVSMTSSDSIFAWWIAHLSLFSSCFTDGIFLVSSTCWPFKGKPVVLKFCLYDAYEDFSHTLVYRECVITQRNG